MKVQFRAFLAVTMCSFFGWWGALSKAVAQNGPGTADDPIFWMLSPPPGWTNYTGDPSNPNPWTFKRFMLPMLTLNKNLSADYDPTAVEAIADTELAYTTYAAKVGASGPDREWFDQNLGVVKYSFGNARYTDFWRHDTGGGPNHEASLTDQADVNPVWFDGIAQAPWQHPFLDGGPDRASAWTQAYRGLWQASSVLPPPAFIYLDIEKHPMTPAVVAVPNSARLFDAIRNDSRASTLNLPYPIAPFPRRTSLSLNGSRRRRPDTGPWDCSRIALRPGGATTGPPSASTGTPT